MIKTHYEILELTAGAKPLDIKKAYRSLALNHHPDRNNGSIESTERFKLISEAYAILSDPHSRKCYDNELNRPTTVSTKTSSKSRRCSTFGKDPYQQFDDIFTNDPFFHSAFEGMDDAFAARFNDTRVKEQTEGECCAFWCCGDGSQNRKNLSLGACIMKSLGIEITVTSYSKQADGSMSRKFYSANALTGSTNKMTRTYTNSHGQKVTVMTLEKDGNVMEDILVGGDIIQRKINGTRHQIKSEEKVKGNTTDRQM